MLVFLKKVALEEALVSFVHGYNNNGVCVWITRYIAFTVGRGMSHRNEYRKGQVRGNLDAVFYSVILQLHPVFVFLLCTCGLKYGKAC